MTLNRKHKLIAALVAALVGVPSLAAPLMTAAGSAPERPLGVHLAVLPEAAGLRRQRRRATRRAIGPRLLSRLRAGRAWSRASGLDLRPWTAMRTRYARGPPRRRP